MELSEDLFLSHYLLVSCFRSEVVSEIVVYLMRDRHLNLIDTLKVFWVFIVVVHLGDVAHIAGS